MYTRNRLYYILYMKETSEDHSLPIVLYQLSFDTVQLHFSHHNVVERGGPGEGVFRFRELAHK